MPSLTLHRCLLIGLFCASSVNAAGFLRTEGQDIVDENGKPVVLRGVGLGNWLLPEGYMWRFGKRGDRPRKIEAIVRDLLGPEHADRFWHEFREHYITEADIMRIAELGFNSVRPALNARLFLTEEDPPQYVEESFVLLDRLITWCSKHGLYVIIDMHGAPGGQTGANIDDSANDLPELFEEAKYQDRLVDLWTTIARRYRDEPTVAAYDLLNEPLPARTGAAGKYKHLLEPFYKRITRAIREVDQQHMITLEGVDWANDWSVFSTPFDDNVFYQFHYYCWDHPVVLHDIRRFLEQRERLNAPVWVGETGEKNSLIYWATTDYFEAYNIGWSFWPWKKMATDNTPYSITAPDDWEAIRAYTRGGPQPTREVARRAFDQLLRNIRLENCVYFPDVVHAMFRRAPVTIEAENFGHEGRGRSYVVKEGAVKAKDYRLAEAVPILLIRDNKEVKDCDYAIALRATEWTEYVVNSRVPRDYAASMRVRASEAPASVKVLAGLHKQSVTITSEDWTEVTLEAIPLLAGADRVRLMVTRGAVEADWIRLQE